MLTTGLLPLMALNLAGSNTNCMLVMKDEITPENILDRLDNEDSSLVKYLLDNSILKCAINLSTVLDGTGAALSLASIGDPHNGIVGKSYNKSFSQLNLPLSASNGNKADFPDALIYVPYDMAYNVATYLVYSDYIGVPFATLATSANPETSIVAVNLDRLSKLDVSQDDSTHALTITENTQSGGSNGRAYIQEFRYSENITTDVLFFKCFYAAAYRTNWASLRLKAFYYNEDTSTWVELGAGALMIDASLHAYRFGSVTAKRFRIYVNGTFEVSSGSGNTSTRLALSKFAFAKENTIQAPVEYTPKVALLLPLQNTIGYPNYTNLFTQANSMNAVVFDLEAEELVYSSPFIDGHSVSLLPNLNVIGAEI